MTLEVVAIADRECDGAVDAGINDELNTIAPLLGFYQVAYDLRVAGVC